VAAAVIAADWVLKASASALDQPVHLHWFHERQHAWRPVIVAIVLVMALGAISRGRLAILGFGMVLGALLGNLLELAAFGRVTDFIPFPPGSVSAPADFFAFGGYVLFCIGMWGDLLRRKRAARST
jgi:lipoprotein signal peptidase